MRSATRSRAFGSPWNAVPGLLLGVVLGTSPTQAGEADVIEVDSSCTAIRTCDFDVTVLHADIGFSHYADRYEVVAPDGEVLGIRVLKHPHVHEQPFMRRLVGVEIPDDVSEVTVRAHDSQHAFGGRSVTLQLEFPTKSPPAETPAQAGESPEADAPQ